MFMQRSKNKSSREGRLSKIKEMLALRKAISKRRPKFIRQESWRYVRVGSSWRKPRGIDSKMRIEKKGWPKKVKVGYRGPKIVRGLHPSGLIDVLAQNENDLQALEPGKHAARLASSIGARKRKLLVSTAEGKGIRVLNSRLSKHN